MNVQQDHGHQQDQQHQQSQRDPKGKREWGKSDYNNIKSHMHSELPDLVTFFKRIQISSKRAYSLSTVASLARGTNSSGGSRRSRGSGGSSHTRLTTVSLQQQISSETMQGS